MKIALWSIAKVEPYGGNPRVITDEAVAKTAASIKEFGWRQPIVVDTAGVVIAGHTRLLAAQSLGLAEVPVHVAEGLSAAQVRAYRLADNRTNQEASWNPSLVGLELQDLAGLDFDIALTGFGPGEVVAFIAKAGATKTGLTDEDATPPAPAKPVSRTGDLRICGAHRVLCGGATIAEDVEALLPIWI